MSNYFLLKKFIYCIKYWIALKVFKGAFTETQFGKLLINTKKYVDVVVIQNKSVDYFYQKLSFFYLYDNRGFLSFQLEWNCFMKL